MCYFMQPAPGLWTRLAPASSCLALGDNADAFFFANPGLYRLQLVMPGWKNGNKLLGLGGTRSHDSRLGDHAISQPLHQASPTDTPHTHVLHTHMYCTHTCKNVKFTH